MDILNELVEKYLNKKPEELAAYANESLTDVDVVSMLDGLKELLNVADNHELIKGILSVKVFRSYIQYLVRTSINGDKLPESDYHGLTTLIFILQTLYNYSKSESPVSDYDYDRLYELMESYDTEMITTPIVGGKIVYHTYTSLRGTLKKVYSLGDEESLANKSRKTLDDWIAECERIYEEKTGRTLRLNEQDVYLFPKWDGISITFEFDDRGRMTHALTRGNTETNEAQEVSHVFATRVFTIRDTEFLGNPYGLKTEVMVKQQDKDSYNKKYNESYRNTRSIASAIIRTDEPGGRENLLEVVRLRTSKKDADGNEILQELHPEVFERPYLVCPLSDRKTIRKWAEDHRSIGGLNTDGVVIYIIDEHIRKVLGRKDNKNQYEVAYKFNEDIGYTKVKDIEFETTSFGRIFPTLLVEKVKLKGNTVQRISLGSINRMRELELRKGDTVKVLYEIVPYVCMDDSDPKCKRTKHPLIPLPTHCPDCGTGVEFTSTGSGIICPNPDCLSRVCGRILTYVTRIGIKEIGEETIHDLVKAGLIKNIPDLYKLKESENLIPTIDGYGELSARKIVKAIETKKVVDAATFMSAIGIETIGKKTFEKILMRYHIDELLVIAQAGSLSKLIEINGIGDTQGIKIIHGIKEKKSLIKKLMKYLTITYPNPEEPKFIAVFHNIRSRAISLSIELAGGKVEDSLTKRASLLIVPNGQKDVNDRTSEKARNYGIPIVEIDEVAEYIKQF